MRLRNLLLPTTLALAASCGIQEKCPPPQLPGLPLEIAYQRTMTRVDIERQLKINLKNLPEGIRMELDSERYPADLLPPSTYPESSGAFVWGEGREKLQLLFSSRDPNRITLENGHVSVGIEVIPEILESIKESAQSGIGVHPFGGAAQITRHQEVFFLALTDAEGDRKFPLIPDTEEEAINRGCRGTRCGGNNRFKTPDEALVVTLPSTSDGSIEITREGLTKNFSFEKLRTIDLTSFDLECFQESRPNEIPVFALKMNHEQGTLLATLERNISLDHLKTPENYPLDMKEIPGIKLYWVDAKGQTWELIGAEGQLVEKEGGYTLALSSYQMHFSEGPFRTSDEAHGYSLYIEVPLNAPQEKAHYGFTIATENVSAMGGF